MSQPTNRPRFEDPLQLVSRVVTKLFSLWISVTYPFESIGRNVRFHPTSQLGRRRAIRIRLGNSVSVGKDAWLNVATQDPAGEPVIRIDDKCHIAYGAMISAKNGIHLEREVLVGQQALIADHNHAFEDVTMPIARQGVTAGGKIRIGQGSWIGHGAVIICARGTLTIGHNCIIGANTVVMQSIPDYSVAFGNPATIIKHYDQATRKWRIGASRRAATRISSTSGRPVTDLIVK